MIEVHHLNNSRSQRILWLCEELGLDYKIVKHQRDATTNLAPPSLLAVHALGKSPVIRDDGQVVIESGAIIEYIVRKHGKGKLAPPESSPQWVRYIQLMHYAEGSAMLPVMLKIYMGRLGDAGKPLEPRIHSEIDNHFGFLDARARRQAVVPRQRALRRRHPALVRDPGGEAALRARQVPEARGLPRARRRAPRLEARAREGRRVDLRVARARRDLYVISSAAFTIRYCPLIMRERSEQKKTTASATSPSDGISPSGMRLVISPITTSVATPRCFATIFT